MNLPEKIFLVCVVFLVPIIVNAQEEPKSVKKRKEQLEKQEEEKQKMAEKAHEEGIEQHMQIQTKETRKRMKKNRRKANRHNNNRREFFLKRWFSCAYLKENIFFAERRLSCKLPV